MQKLKQNFIYDAVYQILVLLLPLITTPYIARVIGATGIGIYSYTSSIVYYFSIFALLGMNFYGNREVSKNRDDQSKLNKTFSSIYYLQLIITTIVITIYIIYLCFFNKQYQSIQLIQIIPLISVAFDINWFFCGMQEFKITVTRSAVIKLISFILIFIFIKTESDLWKYVLILASSTLLNQVILWPFLKGKVKFVQVGFKDIIKHMKPTLILFIPVIATSVYNIMDKIMVGNLTNVTEVGYYENAEKLLKVILSVISALCTVTMPQMTYLYKNKQYDEYYKVLNKSLTFTFFLIFPVIFGFLATADTLVKLYLGNGFMKSATLLKILCFSLLFSPITSIIRMQLLLPRSKDKENITSVVFGAIINLCLNFILIKKYAAIGASISTIIAELTVFCINLYYVKEEIQFKQKIYDIIPIFFKSLIMFIIVFIIGKFISYDLLKLTIQVITGISIYLILNIKYVKENVNIKSFFKKK